MGWIRHESPSKRFVGTDRRDDQSPGTDTLGLTICFIW